MDLCEIWGSFWLWRFTLLPGLWQHVQWQMRNNILDEHTTWDGGGMFLWETWVPIPDYIVSYSHRLQLHVRWQLVTCIFDCVVKWGIKLSLALMLWLDSVGWLMQDLICCLWENAIIISFSSVFLQSLFLCVCYRNILLHQNYIFLHLVTVPHVLSLPEGHTGSFPRL
jgi:hypothetical protein